MDRLRVFLHMVYECRKGVRLMAMCTLPQSYMETAAEKLAVYCMKWFVMPLDNGRMNLFFGEPQCIEMARRLCGKPLNRLSAEEDFILGILLGYSVNEQCRRYLAMEKLLSV